MIEQGIKHRQKALLLILSAGLLLAARPVVAQDFIAGAAVAKEIRLRQIPVEYIHKARNELVIAYQHTSHGTHVSRGMYGLPDYRTGDSVLYALSILEKEEGKLFFMDYALEAYPPGAVDLSAGETTFAETTRNFLDAEENADVNVLMWAWCDISGHDVSGNYLPGMDSLISEYGPGGSKIGTGPGQRELPVTFVFMTGDAIADDNVGEGRPKEQAQLIRDYCLAHGYLCLDYYSIDTHDMDDNYWEDADDDGNSLSYGGNFYQDFQDAHAVGEGFYENKLDPGGEAIYGAHTTQHITSNRKAYAMWWILARIAGWDGTYPVREIRLSSRGDSTQVMTGDTLRFSAAILPAFASNQELAWSVVDGTGSATITSGGLLRGGRPGLVRVVALALDGSGASDTLEMIISDPLVPVTAMHIATEGGLTELDVGSTLQCSALVLPDTASNPTVLWSINDLGGSASVDADGLVTALSGGSVEVIASAEDGSAVADTVQLELKYADIPVADIEISTTGGVTSMEEGSTLQCSATVLPVDATNPELEWSVLSGTGTASVDADGLLSALTAGSIEVVASATDGSGVGDTLALQINPAVILVSEIVILAAGGLTEIEVNQTLQFTVSVAPSNASNPSVSWSVVNGSGTAKICSCGTLTALTPGTVSVVATARDGSGVSASYDLTITSPAGISERGEGEQLIIYPNPSAGRFYLKTESLPFDRLQLVSAWGSVILDLVPDPGDRFIELDLSDRQAGVYLLHAYSGDRSYTQRIIIAR